MSTVNSDDDQRNNQNSRNHRFEAEDGNNRVAKGRKFHIKP